MKTIYIDSEFKCHASNPGNIFEEIETDFFDGKCNAFIEGYRFIPSGKSWKRNDGTVFHGEMISPFKDFTVLESVQKLYEENNAIQADTDEMLIDYEYRLTMLELGVTE